MQWTSIPPRTTAVAFTACLILAGAGCTGHGGHTTKVPVSPAPRHATPSATPPSSSLLPPGFSFEATAAPSQPAVTFEVSPVTQVNPATLKPAPLTSAQAANAAKAVVNLPVGITVRPLLVEPLTLGAGTDVTVAAGGLGQGPHDVSLVLLGPTGRSEKLVRADGGAAAARVKLPSQMPPGTWTLAVEDLSAVAKSTSGAPSPSGPKAVVDLAVFQVR
jgi:hypothetical protein